MSAPPRDRTHVARGRGAFALTMLLLVSVTSCTSKAVDPREGQIVSVMALADEPLIRARPALAAGKYTRMAQTPFDFFRGTLPVYRHDMRSGTSFVAQSRFALDVPLVPSLGDPHPENFGILRASDGTLALEANDFDAADRAPYLWDVRRLATGMALGAILSNPEDASARERAVAARRSIARAAVEGYRAGIESAASNVLPPRVIDAQGNSVIADVFSRSARDSASRRELADYTVLDGATRRLKRGPIDPEDPQSVYADLPPSVIPSIAPALERYRSTLVAQRSREDFTVLDAVREFGSGVASWPRVRVIVLVRGATDDPSDDLMLELKELVDSNIAGLYPPGIFADSVPDRITTFSRGAWGRVDGEALWGATTWLGMPCQVRFESEGQKNIRVDRFVDEEGTVEALLGLARILGGLVARMHASGNEGLSDARAIYGRIVIDPEGFLDEQADIGVAYAELVLADHARFVRALHRVGLRLGIPFDPIDEPRPDLAALFGVPPPPSPLPALP